MIEHFAQVAGALVLAPSIAIVAIALLRQPLLRAFGAVSVLRLWWLLPVALATLLLPKEVAREVAFMPIASSPAAPGDWLSAERGYSLMPAIAVLWLAGSLAMAGWYCCLQYRFGRLIQWRGSRGTLPPMHAPAVVGALRPRLVLPRDFARQFDSNERRLVLLHERIHMRRRDGAANLLMATLVAVQWFNPLVHWAARTLRRDQETSCDAIVIARHPKEVERYAGALLKALPQSRAVPLACTWHRTHPLVERIRMLDFHRDLRPRSRVAAALICVSAALVSALAYAAKPETSIVAASQAASARDGAGLGDGVLFKVVFMKDGKVVSSPAALGQFGQELTLEIAGTMKIRAVAGAPESDHRSPTAVKLYLFQDGQMRLMQEMSMRAVLSATPSFEYTVPGTPYRFVVMPRLAKLPASN